MALLAEGGLSLGPFDFELEPTAPEGIDAVVLARSKEPGLGRRFVCECRTEWTRRALEQAVEKLRRAPKPFLPLVVFPYLSEEHLDELQARRVSGIDLCGNGLLVDLPRLFVLRSGAKKTFTVSSTTTSVYQSRNVASLVARAFLTQPSYPTATAVLDTCHARSMPVEGRPPSLVLPTISKAIKRLEHDLVVTRQKRSLRLRDPDRLLASLARYFRRIEPVDSARFLGKTALSPNLVWSRLKDLRPTIRSVVTGRGSAGHYTGLAGPDRLQLHVSDLRRVVSALEARSTAAFPNIEIVETQEEGPYFDAREESGVVWSSPVQTYLEMAEGTAREASAALELRGKILRGIEALSQ